MLYSGKSSIIKCYSSRVRYEYSYSYFILAPLYVNTDHVIDSICGFPAVTNPLPLLNCVSYRGDC